MKILIIGLGYAGTRFKRAFKLCGITEIYSVGRGESINQAIFTVNPDIVVVSSTDLTHYDVLMEIKDYTGFVICEKPLITPHDNLLEISKVISNKHGFCFNLIERYSEITIQLKKYVETHNLNLIRANFQWGKDRLNDKRNTCGVISEVIHGLDLIQHICKPSSNYVINAVLGCTSDFSISGEAILDSVLLTATLDGTPITSYSSFVNIIRRREIDLTFLNSENKIIYANLVYDTPEWDCDYLKIWRPTQFGDENIFEFKTTVDNSNDKLSTIRKVVILVSDVINVVKTGLKPS
jgi:predicted dehydrogenase